MLTQIWVIDEKYADLPPRVRRLETRVFTPLEGQRFRPRDHRAVLGHRNRCRVLRRAWRRALIGARTGYVIDAAPRAIARTPVLDHVARVHRPSNVS